MATKGAQTAAKISAIDHMPEWVRLTAAYWTFPMARNDAEHELMEREIRQTINRNPPGNDELCRAVRWLAGPENRQEKCPTLRELVRAVFILRKQARQNQYATDANSGKCALCNFGWLAHYHGWTPCWRMADYAAAYVSAIPCRCSRGDSWMTLKDYVGIEQDQSERIEKMRDAAIEQARGRIAALAGCVVVVSPAAAAIVETATRAARMQYEDTEGGW